MAPHVATFGLLQLNTFSLVLHQITAHAVMVHTIIPYHHSLKMTISVNSGNPAHSQPQEIYYTNYPLWDCAGCVSGSCCTFNSPPWFCKDLSTPTTDDIELRVCLDYFTYDEDVLFELVELYVQEAFSCLTAD